MINLKLNLINHKFKIYKEDINKKNKIKIKG